MTAEIFDRTGVKCLPKPKVSQAQGIVLHDCHAEVVALRAFNRFLIDECAMLVHDSNALSNVVEARPPTQITRRSPQPFVIRHDVTIHIYCSEAPCGDASMELIMQAQKDSTPWQLPESTSGVLNDGADETPLDLKGRGFFSELGIVRRKPGSSSFQVVSVLKHSHYE